MIYFCAVHWKNACWIERQLRHIKAYTLSDYRVLYLHTDLDGSIPDDEHVIFSEETQIREHAVKLDILAWEACRHSTADDDILVFLDSDAFPVASWEAECRQSLVKHKLVAVKRLENLGDPQPHPCFCVTTSGFWKEIGGTWAAGHKWRNEQGEKVTDVGGNLLKHLERADAPWLPLLRSNVYDPHPLWFGVYGGIVYHHGAGSRSKLSRLDRGIISRRMQSKYPIRILLVNFLSKINKFENLTSRARRIFSLKKERRNLEEARESSIVSFSNKIEIVADSEILTDRKIDVMLQGFLAQSHIES